MEKRSFYIALGVPKGEKNETVHLAYRKLVVRYRRELAPLSVEEDDDFEDATLPPLSFGVIRPYSDRRHAALFNAPDLEISKPVSEIDHYFDGYVPEVILHTSAKQHGKDLFVEIRIDENLALRGGLFPIHIPVVKPCIQCAEIEEPQRFSCRSCQGTGKIAEDRVIEVTIPPGVKNGQTARIPMEDVGLKNTDLLVYVLVS